MSNTTRYPIFVVTVLLSKCPTSRPRVINQTSFKMSNMYTCTVQCKHMKQLYITGRLILRCLGAIHLT